MKTFVWSVLLLSVAAACSRTGLDIDPELDDGVGSGGLGMSTGGAGNVPQGGGPGTGGTGSGAGGAPVSVGGSSGVAGSPGQPSAANICGPAATGGGAATGGAGATGVTSDEAPVVFCGTAGCIEGTDAPMTTPRLPVRCGDVECGAPKACCLRSLRCYDPRTEPEKCLPPDSGVDKEWGRPACASNAHCPRSTLCQLDNQDWWNNDSDQAPPAPPPMSCQGVGRCMPIGNCGNFIADCPICGCDGNLYRDQIEACLAGSNVGPCR
jgi:hypothetical protein